MLLQTIVTEVPKGPKNSTRLFTSMTNRQPIPISFELEKPGAVA